MNAKEKFIISVMIIFLLDYDLGWFLGETQGSCLFSKLKLIKNRLKTDYKQR